MSNHEIKIIEFDSPTYWKWVQLREIILRLPLGKRFHLDDLHSDIHEIIFAIMEGNKILGGAQLVVFDNTAKMRQVAVKSTLQSAGLGTELMHFMESYCMQNNINSIYCHARDTACNFYKKNKYLIVGDQFSEVGIPHYKMIKYLSKD